MEEQRRAPEKYGETLLDLLGRKKMYFYLFFTRIVLGGLKIWECTDDLALHLVDTTNRGLDFKNKAVLDLGCGAGILGILALKLGAECVDFQDYVSWKHLLLVFSL